MDDKMLAIEAGHKEQKEFKQVVIDLSAHIMTVHINTHT